MGRCLCCVTAAVASKLEKWLEKERKTDRHTDRTTYLITQTMVPIDETVVVLDGFTV